MANNKKITYKRITATNALRDVIMRLEDFIQGKADKEYPLDITEVIVFGSYAKGAEQVHDLDIYISLTEHREKYAAFCNENGLIYHDMLEVIENVINAFVRYMKARKHIISIHSNIYYGPQERDVAISDTHYIILQDGKLNYDVIEEFMAL